MSLVGKHRNQGYPRRYEHPAYFDTSHLVASSWKGITKGTNPKLARRRIIHSLNARYKEDAL